MKLCASCGASLPDQASMCVICGSKEFKAPNPPRIQKQQNSYGYQQDQYAPQSNNNYEQNGYAGQYSGGYQNQYGQQYDNGYQEQYPEQQYEQYDNGYQEQYPEQQYEQYDNGYQEQYPEQQYEQQYAQQPQYEQQYAQPEQYEQQYAQPEQYEQQYAQPEQYAQAAPAAAPAAAEPAPEEPKPEEPPVPEEPKENPYEVSKNFKFEKVEKDEDEEEKKPNPLVSVLKMFTETPDHTDDFNPDDAAANKKTSIIALFGITFWVPLAFSPNSVYSRYYANQGLIMLFLTLPFTLLYSLFFGIVSIACTVSDGEVSYLSASGWLAELILAAIFYALPVFVLILMIKAVRQGKAKEVPFLGWLRIIR